MSTTVDPRRDGPVVAERPAPGAPRPYQFPAVERARSPNGLALARRRPARAAARVGVAGPRGGAVDEPAEQAGATVLAARALTEGTERYDAIALVEAAERLGASLHAEAGWDALSRQRRRAGRAPRAGARARRRGRPAADVPGGRGRAAPRRAPERPAPGQGRPAPPRRRGFVEHDLRARLAVPPAVGGTARRSRGSTPDDLRAAYERGARSRAGRRSSSAATSAGRTSRPSPSACSAAGTAPAERRAPTARSSTPAPRRAVRPRHPPAGLGPDRDPRRPRGLPRRIPDFHAVSVMSAILGGLFNSRLNLKLREEKGYTYGAGAGLRHAPRRRAVRRPRRREHRGHRARPSWTCSPSSSGCATRRSTATSCDAARDYLVGVFPLRFETAGRRRRRARRPGRPRPADRRADRYRPRIEAVDADAVAAAARAHPAVDEAAIVLVGDADAFPARARGGRPRPDRGRARRGAGCPRTRGRDGDARPGRRPERDGPDRGCRGAGRTGDRRTRPPTRRGRTRPRADAGAPSRVAPPDALKPFRFRVVSVQ